jgi:hypothetical protein
MGEIMDTLRKLAEPVRSTNQDVFNSLRQTSISNVILGKRKFSEPNNTEGESERPSTLEFGSSALRLGNKILRTNPFIPDKPSTLIEQSRNENAIEAGPLDRNDQRGDNSIRHKLRDKDYRDHQISSNREDNYRQLHHGDRSRFLKPSAFSTAGHYTISKDYTRGEEVRRSHLLEIYGRKCGTKQGGQVIAKQQEEEMQKNQLRTPTMDPIEAKPSMSPETNETQQQMRVHKSPQGA